MSSQNIIMTADYPKDFFYLIPSFHQLVSLLNCFKRFFNSIIIIINEIAPMPLQLKIVYLYCCKYNCSLTNLKICFLFYV